MFFRTAQPTTQPSSQPSRQPTEQPSRQPTQRPTTKSYGKTGYYASVSYSDAGCRNVTSGVYYPLGVCNYVPGTPASSFLYTADPSASYQLYVTSYAQYGNCTGSATTTAVPGSAACVAAASGSSVYAVTAAYLPALPALGYPYAKTTYVVVSFLVCVTEVLDSPHLTSPPATYRPQVLRGGLCRACHGCTHRVPVHPAASGHRRLVCVQCGDGLPKKQPTRFGVHFYLPDAAGGGCDHGLRARHAVRRRAVHRSTGHGHGRRV